MLFRSHTTFYRIKELPKFTVASGNTYFSSDDDGCLYSSDKKDLYAVPSNISISGGTYTVNSSVENIIRCAFTRTKNLVKLVLPPNLQSVATEYPSFMTNATSLEAFDIASGGTTPFRVIDGVLFNDDSLIKYPPAKSDENYAVPAGITSIGKRAFDGALYMKSIDLNDVVTLTNEALYACHQLQTVTLPKNLKVEGVSGAITNCQKLSEYKTPEDCVNFEAIDGVVYSKGDHSTLYFFPPAKAVTEGKYTVGNWVKTIERGAFMGTHTIEELTIPTSVETITMNAFQSMANLNKITFEEPSSVQTIGVLAFSYCPKLKEVTLPTSLTVLDRIFMESENLETINVPDGSKLKTIAESAFIYNKNLKNFNFLGECDLTTIGKGAFQNLSLLQEFKFPKGVTDIGANAFNGCTSMTTATFDENAVITTIGAAAFADCGLTSIDIPNSVTKLESEAFRNCAALTVVNVSENLTDISSEAFKYCENLVDINVDKNNPTYSSVDGYLLSKNKQTLVLFPHGKAHAKFTLLPPSITTIGDYAFYNCSKLTSVNIPSSITNIGNSAFSGCTDLTKAIIADIAKWCNISFGNSSSNPLYYAKHIYSDESTEITDLVIPDGVATIGGSAFFYCSNLKSVTIPSSVTFIDSHAFDECSGLTKVIVPDIAKWCSISFGTYGTSNPLSYAHHLYSDKNTEITELVIPDGVTSVNSNTFKGCLGLTSVTIPKSVISIDGSAFSGCSALTNVTLNSNALVSNTYTPTNSLSSIFGSQVSKYVIGNDVTSIGNNAFYGCTKLTSVNIPPSVTTIGNDAFKLCSELMKVIVPDIAKWCDVSFGNDFSNPLYYAKHIYSDENTEVTEIAIPKSVTGISNIAFINCYGINSIIVEDGNAVYDSRDNCNAIIETSTNTLIVGCKNTIIPSSITKIGDNAFLGQSDLASITIHEGITTIGKDAFAGCTSLKDVTLNSKTIVSKDSNPLRDLFGLQVKKYTIGEGITSIGSGAFSGCSELASVTIPSTVTSIGDWAFDGCSSLDKIYVKKGSEALFLVWISMPSNVTTYDTDMTTKLPKPYMDFKSSTQTTLTFQLHNNYKEYTYSVGKLYAGDKSQFVNGTATIAELSPETTYTTELYVNGIEWGSVKSTTSQLGVQIPLPQTTASSVNVSGTYTKGDANVVSTSMTFNGKTVEGNSISVKGLNPNTKYTAKYDVVVAYGKNNAETKTYTKTAEITTASLTFRTAQPKVVSLGNVIVGATTNVDDAETNVGFEWRREDWPDFGGFNISKSITCLKPR